MFLNKYVNCLRPGGFGDIVMTSAAVAQFPPDVKINYYSSAPELASYIDHPSLQAWDYKHWDDRPVGRDIAFLGYDPNMRHENHLVARFCEEAGVPVPDPIKPRMRKTISQYAGLFPYITIQSTSGWSAYKDFPFFEEVMEFFPMTHFIELDESLSWHDTLSLIQNATMHVGVDSVCQHIAAAYNIPAVIVYGSTDPALSGYATATNLRFTDCPPCHIDTKFSNGFKYGTTCNDPCVLKISILDVVEAIKERRDAN